MTQDQKNKMSLFVQDHGRLPRGQMLSRMLSPRGLKDFEKALAGVPHAVIGEVTNTGRLEVFGLPQPVRDAADEPSELRVPKVVDAPIADLKEVWQKPLRW